MRGWETDGRGILCTYIGGNFGNVELDGFVSSFSLAVEVYLPDGRWEIAYAVCFGAVIQTELWKGFLLGCNLKCL